MDEEIQRFISIFDPNKRIDFTKVLTNDITRSEYAVLWMYKNMAQNSDVVYVSVILRQMLRLRFQEICEKTCIKRWNCSQMPNLINSLPHHL